MGFLDNSTNNIIVDAVLTDYGRELLARNDGSFSIVKFALGDDEIDYTTIKKFGRTVGKEKIEKNTPIFEAQTNQNLGLKYKLVSLSNPTLTRMPGVVLSGDISTSTGTSAASGIIAMKRSGAAALARLNVAQTVADESTMDPELVDQSFIVKLPYQFLDLAGTDLTPESIDSDNVATYVLTRDSITKSTGAASLTLDVQTRSISDSVFDVYGSSADRTVIETEIEVIGVQSGVSTMMAVTVGKS
jgi:hypothetical protein